MKKLIEEKLPLSEVNKLCSKEAGFIRIPKIHNIHTWFARRPAGAARVLSLSSVFPSNIDIEILKECSGLSEALSSNKVIYMTKVNREKIVENVLKYTGKKPEDIVVVDPMAGGGSIPLESLRLGFRTIAIDYNPVAYLILKATIEFPAKYADAGLFEETLKAARELISKARDELGRFYGEDSENYIFARGVRCSSCNGLIPVQGIEPVITKATKFKKRFLKLTYEREKKNFIVETTDIETKRTIKKRGNYIQCPYCRKWFQLRGRVKTGLTAFDKWFVEHAKLMESIVEGFASVTPELEEKLLELHIPMVKQVGSEFMAVWGDKDERERFVSALKTLSNGIFELQSYIPLDEIPDENKWASSARNKKLTKWYTLFNPRQLLAVAKLSKIVAGIAEKLASKDGEFGAAVATYLAFAIDKIVDYNTIATKWQGSSFKTGIGNTLRGESTIDFRQEYCEMVVTLPERSLEWALEPSVAESSQLTKTTGGILPVLRFLCNEFQNSGLNNRVNVYLGDATRLSEILGINAVDIINVDPPYFEQVIYSDKSEIFWVILRRSLAPVLELLFKPGFRLSKWSWTNSKILREKEVVSYSKREKKRRRLSGGESDVDRYRRLFKDFAKETWKVLKDDGILVLWFTHPTDLAWRTIGESLYDAGYVVSKIWPVQTEMRTRYKKQVNIVAQEMSLIIVARKYSRKKLLEVGARNIRLGLLNNPEFLRVIEEVVEDSRTVARETGASPADTATLLFGSALSVATRFEIPGVRDFNMIYDPSVTAVVKRFVEPLVEKITLKRGPVKLDLRDSSRVVELVTSAMLRNPATRSYITLWMLSRVDLETGISRDQPLALSYDFAQTTAKLCGYDFDKLREIGLLGETIASDEEIESEESERKSKAYYPQMFEALSAARARSTWSRISLLTPGRAIYLAYLALTESGAPAVRADSIRSRIPTWSERDISEAAALATILLETARDVDLGYKSSSRETLEKFFVESKGSDASVARELAIRTLLYLLPRS